MNLQSVHRGIVSLYPGDSAWEGTLAQAYAVHVMDVFEHYRFRHEIQTKGAGAFSGLEATDAWQDKFFDAGHPASRDANVWFPD